MAEHIPKLANKQFQNWLKAHLAINITKEETEEYVSEKIKKFHQELLKEMNDEVCNQCSLENVLPCTTRGICNKKRTGCSFHSTPEKQFRVCPKNICNRIKDKIRNGHKYSPSWSNTKSEKWCQNPWEIAKCFMPPDGYTAQHTAEETDLNGIISVMLNHRDLLSEIDSNKCEEVREVSRKLRHSPDVCIENTTMQGYFDKLISFLDHLYKCTGIAKVDSAARKISQLKQETLTISHDDVTKTLQEILEANTKQSIHHLDKKTTESLETIKNELLKGKDAFQELAKSSIDRIEQAAMGSTEKQYQNLKQELVTDLITYYEDEHGAIPVSPFTKTEEVPLLLFYVPVKKVVERCYSTQRLKLETRKPVTLLEDVFMNGPTMCRHVYMTGKAGIGKTTFAKRLCLIWSQAKRESNSVVITETIQETELQMMEKFDFVFLILLREMSEVSEIDEMVCSLLKSLSGSHNYMSYPNFQKDLLHKETCLIILDGLDEWSCPNVHIPKRIPRSKCTVLTTTRAWKMQEAVVPSSKVEKQIEMIGLGVEATKDLIRNVLTYLTGTDDHEETVSNFNEHVKDKDLENMLSTPVILIQFLCLWQGGRSTGNTKCELYINVIEFMLHHGKNKIVAAEKENLISVFEQTNGDSLTTPTFLQDAPYCKKYYHFMLRVGKLAFETLFSENKKHSLVLYQSVVDKFLSKEELKSCFHMGLLTQSRSKRYDDDEVAVTFIHKTFQEFFSALYLQSLSDEACVKCVQNACSSVQVIVDMANVFVFLSGLNFHQINLLSKGFCDGFSQDNVTSEYRRQLNIHNKMEDFSKPLKDLQDMYVACVNECKDLDRNKVKISYEDVIYVTDCRRDKYLTAIEHLVCANQDSLKSLFINTEGTNKIISTVMLELNLSSIHHLEKIILVCELTDGDLLTLITNSKETLKSLSIKSLHWEGTKWNYRCISLSESTVTVLVETIPRLETFALECFTLTHSQIGNLLRVISQSKNLEQICVGKLYCSNHRDSCEGFNFDLSQHPHLDVLEFGSLHLSDFNVNVSHLEICALGRFPERILTTMCDRLTNARTLTEFSCLNFETYENIVERLLQTAYELPQLRRIYIQQIDIGSHLLRLSPKMHSIESVELNRVKMAISVLKDLVQLVATYKNSVTVTIRNSHVDPEAEYTKLRSDISRGSYVVLFDGDTELNYHLFVFKTYGNN